jgi:hypothetical protein
MNQRLITPSFARSVARGVRLSAKEAPSMYVVRIVVVLSAAILLGCSTHRVVITLDSAQGHASPRQSTYLGKLDLHVASNLIRTIEVSSPGIYEVLLIPPSDSASEKYRVEVESHMENEEGDCIMNNWQHIGSLPYETVGTIELRDGQQGVAYPDHHRREYQSIHADGSTTMLKNELLPSTPSSDCFKDSGNLTPHRCYKLMVTVISNKNSEGLSAEVRIARKD